MEQFNDVLKSKTMFTYRQGMCSKHRAQVKSCVTNATSFQRCWDISMCGYTAAWGEPQTSKFATFHELEAEMK